MKHLIILSVESLRADVFDGTWVAPNLNHFAASGVLFNNCHTPGLNTVAGQAAILTGKYPIHNGARLHFPNKLCGPSLANILSAEGFHTVASVEYKNDFKNAELLSDFAAQPADLKKSLRAIRAARSGGKRTFLFVQSGLLHPSYGSKKSTTPSYADRVQNLDHGFFKKFWLDIQKLGLETDTLIVLVGAHGEGLSRERGLGHGRSLDEGALRVPLVLWGNSIPSVRNSQVISTVDIAPTCLGLLKISKSYSFQGLDRSRFLGASAKGPSSLAYAEAWSYDKHYWRLLSLGAFAVKSTQNAWNGSWKKLRDVCRLDQQTLRKGRYKWIIKHEGLSSSEALYDIQKDPGEYFNLLSPGKKTHSRHRKIARVFKKTLAKLEQGLDLPFSENLEKVKLHLPIHSQDNGGHDLT